MKKNACMIVFLAMPLVGFLPGRGFAAGADTGGKDRSAAQLRQVKAELELSKESYDRLMGLYMKKEAETKALAEKVSLFSSEFADFQQLIDRLKKEKEELVTGQDKVAKRLQELEKQKDAFDQQGSAAQKEKDDLAKAATDARKQVEELTARIAKSDAEKLALAGEAEKLRKRPDLQSELEQARQKLAEAARRQEELKNLAAQNDALRGEAQKQQQEQARKLEAVTAELSRLKKVPDFKGEAEQLKGRLSVLQEEHSRLQKESKRQQDLARRLDDATSRLEKLGMERNAAVAELAQLRNRPDFKGEAEQLTGKVLGLEEVRDKLLEEAKGLRDVDRKLAEANARIEKLGSEKDTAIIEIDRLKRQANFKAEAEQLTARVAALEEENSRMRDSISAKDGLRKTVEELTTKAQKAAAEKDAAVAELARLKSAPDFKAEAEKLRARVAALEKERPRMQDAVSAQDGLRKTVEALTAKAQKAAAEKDAAVAELARLKNAPDSKAEAEQLKEKMLALHEDNARLQAELKKQPELARKFDDANARLAKLQEAGKRLDDANAYIEKISAEKNRIAAELDAARKQPGTRGEVEQLKAKLMALQEERLRLIEDLKRQQERKQPDPGPGNDQLRVQVSALTAQLAEIRTKTEARVRSEADAQIKVLNEKIAGMEKGLKEAQDLSYQLVQEKAGFQNTEKTLKARVKELEEQKLTIDQLNQNLAARNGSFEKEYAGLSEQFARLQVQFNDADRQKQELKEKIDAGAKEMAAVSGRLAAAEGGRIRLQEQIDLLKKEKDDLAAKMAQESAQHEQEISLLKTDTEQELARKEGTLVRMSQKLEELKATRQAGEGILTQKLGAAQKELTSQKELSFKLVQEKAVFESRQVEMAQRSADLEKQNAVILQEKAKLEEQNAFLKNQYVTISQELNSLREQYAKVIQGRPVETVLKNSREREQSLMAARKDMEGKLQDYSGRLKEYEQQIKGKEDVERQNKQLADDFARLQESYDRLERKYAEAEENVQRQETVKQKYEKLPQENTTLHYNLGVLYAQNQQYAKAVTEFEKVLEVRPDDTESLYNLGVIYGEHLKNRKKAIAHFKRYLAAAPDDADAQRVRKFILTWETYGQDIHDGK